MGRACGTHGIEKKYIQGSGEEHRWKNNIKIDLEKIGKEGENGLIWLRMAISGGLL
jgi:hypothetical protein